MHSMKFSGTEQIANNLPNLNGELLAVATFEVKKDKTVNATVMAIDPKASQKNFSFPVQVNNDQHYLRTAQSKGAFSLTETELELGAALKASGTLSTIAKALGQSQRKSTPSKASAFASPLDRPTMGFLFHASTGKIEPVVLGRSDSYAQHPRLCGPDNAPTVVATNGGNTLLRIAAKDATTPQQWQPIAKTTGKITMISLPRKDGKIVVTYKAENGKLMARAINPNATGNAVLAGKAYEVKGGVIRAEENWKATFVQGKNPREINVTIQRASSPASCSSQPKALQPKADQPASVPTL